MRRSYGLWTGTAALVLSFMCDPARAQVTFNAFVEGCLITSVSADGSVVVGSYGGGSNADLFRWTAVGGVEMIAPKGAYGIPYISRDGRTIVGAGTDSAGNLNAAIWQGGRNWKILTPFAGAVPGETRTLSYAAYVSGDGTVIVGAAYVSLS